MMHGSTEWPRLLVIAASPVSGLAKGTDVTLSNLLGSWPAESIAQVYIGGSYAKEEVLGRAIPIDARNLPFDYALRKILNRSGALLGSSAPTSAAVPINTHRDLTTRIHMAMRFAADASPLRVPPSVEATARDFGPDVVYSMLGNLRIMNLAQKLVAKLGKPLIPHFMDDWVNTLYTSGEFWGLSKKVLDRRVSQLMRSAGVGLAIGQLMSQEYSAKFGIPFSVVANPADDEFFSIPDASTPDSSPVLMYVGGLHLGRAGALADVADALQAHQPSIGKEGPKARLVVHCPDKHLDNYGQELRGRIGLTFGGELGPSDVASALAKADVLLHVESGDADVTTFTRLSVSTKIPQYLAAGRPILCYAPGSLASSQLILASGGGLVVSRQPELIGAVDVLLSDDSHRQRLGTRGRSYAQAHLSRRAVDSRFRDAIRTAMGRAEGR